MQSACLPTSILISRPRPRPRSRPRPRPRTTIKIPPIPRCTLEPIPINIDEFVKLEVAKTIPMPKIT